VLTCLAEGDIGGHRLHEAFVDHVDPSLHLLRPGLSQLGRRERALGESRVSVKRFVDSLSDERAVGRRQRQHLGEKVVAGGG
jgi:hypothetical protein